MEYEESKWKGLYKIGGISAILAAVLLLIEIIVFTIWPQPGTVIGYFTLFQSNKLIGLIDFYLLEFIAYILFVPMFLALYVALKRCNGSYMIIALSLSVLGVAIFLATNNSFSMLSLSNQYMAATTEAQKSIMLAAGQTMLVNTGQRAFGGFNTSFLLISIAGIIVSAIMLRSDNFGRNTSYVGIFAFAISLAEYVRMIIVPSELTLLLIIAILSGVFLMIWLVLVGLNLIKLSN